MSQTKKPSAKSSKPSTAKRSRVARDILAGARDMLAHARGELALPMRIVPGPQIDVRGIREKMRLSQSEFARRYGFSTRTLQEWEQGRTQPDSAVRGYLTVIERNPKAVAEALGGQGSDFR